MVETRERDVVYTTDASDGPSTVLVVLFSLLIVAVLGFMVYYFANNNVRMDNPTTIIERNTTTTQPVPMPTPVPSPINITPPSTNSGSAPSDSSSSGNTTP
jgi:hypothetical protein